MKIMISYPPLISNATPMLTQNRQFQWYHLPSFIYPIIPAMAATMLDKDGFEVIWNDCIAEGWSQQDFYTQIEREQPQLIVIETKTPVINQHWKIIEQVKKISPRTNLILMGDHVTALPSESMENSLVDYVITGGDYDMLILGIARHMRDKTPLPAGIWYRDNGSIKNTGAFELNQDLNELPFLNRQLTKSHLYGEKWHKYKPFFYTMVGRDCPWNKCTFCSWTTIYPRFRVREPESLLDEIGFLIEQHGAREIFDDTGTFPAGGWLRKFCKGMIERGYNKQILFSANMRYGTLSPDLVDLMKKAGFRKLKMGLESANQHTLDLLKKGIEKQNVIDDCRMISEAGIDIHLTSMVGYPWEKRADALQTIEFVRNLMNDGYVEMLQCTIIIPYPGTELHKMALENKWFRFDPHEYERYDMSEPLLKVPDMSPEEVSDICRSVYKSFFSPQFIIRRLSKVRSWNDVNYIIRGSKAVTGHLIDFMRSG